MALDNWKISEDVTAVVNGANKLVMTIGHGAHDHDAIDGNNYEFKVYNTCPSIVAAGSTVQEVDSNGLVPHGLSWEDPDHESESTVITFDFSKIFGSTLIDSEDDLSAVVKFCSVFTVTWDGKPINFIEVAMELTISFNGDYAVEGLGVASLVVTTKLATATCRVVAARCADDSGNQADLN